MEVTNAVITACKAQTGKGPQRARAHPRPNAVRRPAGLDDHRRAHPPHRRPPGLIAESRRLLHDQVADATQSTVETATSRVVIATRSHIDFNRNTAILVFILGRAA